MTDRIKLTEDDIWINEDFSNDYEEFKNKQQFVWCPQLPWMGSEVEAEQLKQQILEDYENSNVALSFRKLIEELTLLHKCNVGDILELSKEDREKAQKWDMLGDKVAPLEVCKKLESKLNQMEIAFEMINNDRTKLLEENKQLKEKIEK